MKDLGPRIFGGVVYAGLLVFGAWQGGVVQWTIFVLLAGVLSEELSRLLGLEKLMTIAFVLVAFVFSKMFSQLAGDYLFRVVCMLVIWGAMSFWSLMSKRKSVIMTPFAGLLYIGLPLSCLLLFVKNFDPSGYDAFAVFLLFYLIWASDVFAFFVGRWLGRRPLWKEISPKKTLEGSIGGLALTILIMPLILWWFQKSMNWHYVVIGIVTIVAGMYGDLFESKLKRLQDVKDSGRLIPGHGGLLDRMDSILFAIPWYIIMSLLLS